MGDPPRRDEPPYVRLSQVMEGKQKTHQPIDIEYLGEDSLDSLNYKQRVLFASFWESLIQFLREKGKNPKRNSGYAESNLPTVARRIHQVNEYCWENGPKSIKLSTDGATQFVEDLNDDQLLTNEGEPYAESSKRKFVEAIEAYFRFRGEDWDSPVDFGDGEYTAGSDPFRINERDALMESSLEYNTPPSYKNVSPEERDRWNTYLAQVLGKPKDEIGPDDWEELQKCWKIPSLISVSLDIGPRAALISRLTDDNIGSDNQTLHIDPETAVKNDRSWTNELSDRSATLLRRWLEQRANKEKYDDSDHIWLNRKGNPYDSKSLNRLLRNLIEEAGIDQSGRKLTWHSIRHSTGMYIYNEEKDIGLVAEILRQASLEAARTYCHPTPETKQDLLESIQGGGAL